MTITVNGSLCSNNSYVDKPCVSVTICTPATSTCQTINDILLDSGDSGLRIFKQVLSVPDAGYQQRQPVPECIQYADGSSVWGPVKKAGVVLGNEPASRSRSKSSTPRSAIPRPDAPARCRPRPSRVQRVPGVSFFAQDCGTTFETAQQRNLLCMRRCDLHRSKVELADQVQNPWRFSRRQQRRDCAASGVPSAERPRSTATWCSGSAPAPTMCLRVTAYAATGPAIS